MKNWWQATSDEVKRELKTDLSRGLSGAEAAERLGKYGPNRLAEKAGVSAFSIFVRQFDDFIIWVLFGAAAVSGGLRERIDLLCILGIILLKSALGVI